MGSSYWQPAAATYFAPAYENPIPTDDAGHELLTHSFGTSQSGASRITPKMYAGEGQIRGRGAVEPQHEAERRLVEYRQQKK